MRKAGQDQRGTIVQLGLRLPEALHKKLTALAIREKRSLNDEILWLIEHGIEATK
ncbi:MAG: toxin-antitoxin system HicB family antitoxin [Elusimicrobia bacterium]|nr:toxin-antitoxin system HicB family antitoxin [Elusimicrobiota bacterium]